MNSKIKYTFGDTPTADDRLKRIAAFFNPLAGKVIQNILDFKVEKAVDIGCGPGYTTEMVHNATNAFSTTGIDKSVNFIEAARLKFPELSFKVHDVTVSPFPDKADFMYCRFVLSHLNNIEKVISSWVSNLNENGLLFIDELEHIDNKNPLFATYLEVNTKLIESQGAQLYVGKEIEKAVQNLNVVFNESSVLPVENRTAAFWFYPNTVSVWKTDEFVNGIVTENKRIDIAKQMFDLSHSENDESNITWIMKRIIIKKQ